MTPFLFKLGFVHRRLWQRDATYRAAALLGPPSLLGAGMAALVWAGMQALQPAGPAAAARPPWATVSGPRIAVSTDPPRVVAPAMALRSSGLVPGWQGAIQPVAVDATMDVDVLGTQLAQLVFDKPGFELKRIIAAGPATGRFVGVGIGALVVRVAGIHALTLRMERADADRVTCLQRLVFVGQRVVSNVQLDQSGPATLEFEPVSFALQPGLYPIAAAFGCWDGEQEKGAGTMSVLIRRPDEQDLRPARPDEIIRAVAGSP